MLVVRGTKKFLDRVGRPVADPPSSSTALGDWYANVLSWRPQVALFVNAVTFIPVLTPFAPSTNIVTRFPSAMADVMQALGIDRRFVGCETDKKSSVVLAKTASRQVLGVMNEFVFMAEHAIDAGRVMERPLTPRIFTSIREQLDVPEWEVRRADPFRFGIGAARRPTSTNSGSLTSGE